MEELVRVPTTRGSNVQNVAGSVRAIRYQYSLNITLGQQFMLSWDKLYCHYSPELKEEARITFTLYG
jgi:hypothetical protein